MKLRWVCTSDYCSIAGQIWGGGEGGGKGCNSSRLFTFILVPDPKQLLS